VTVDNAGKTITIENFYVSGIQDESLGKDVVLYERDDVTKLRTTIFDMVDEQKNGGGIRCWGPPGCGKSGTTFACVVQLAEEKKKSVLWIHYPYRTRKEAIALRIYFDDSNNKIVESATVSNGDDGLRSVLYEGLPIVSNAERTNAYDVLVVDGCVAGVHDDDQMRGVRICH